jgi:hypothetical protein
MIGPATVIEALDEVREPVRAQINEVLETTAVVGLQGPAHVGKTTLLRRAMQGHGTPWGAPVMVDLDGAFSASQLRWTLLRSLARTLVDPISFSHVTTLDRSVWPSRARVAALTIARELGDLADVALDDRGPPRGWDVSTGQILEIVGRMSRTRPLTLVFEHLEAPSTTARHPVDVDELLWQVRAVSQRRPKLQVVMTARQPAVEIAAGARGAFHGDGRWITLSPPDVSMWMQVAALLGDGVSAGVPACAELSGGHVPTMARLLADRRSWNADGPRRVFDELSMHSVPYAARCVEHARSLHRLGAVLLAQVARHERPYAAVPSAGPKEVGRALHVLGLAGLVHQPMPRQWKVTDPLVAHALRGLLPVFPPDPSDDVHVST